MFKNKGNRLNMRLLLFIMWKGKRLYIRLEKAMSNLVDVVIPVYKPGKKFYRLLDKLADQTIVPGKVILMNTETENEESSSEVLEKNIREFFSNKQTLKETALLNIEIVPVKKAEYDHGGTRDAGIKKSDATYVLLMTQDAVPRDAYLVEKMLAMFTTEDVGVVYARQLAWNGTSIVEAYSRLFNYPAHSQVHSKEDMDKLGIKTFFNSDVCSMYNRKVYIAAGGFSKKTIFNEDMIFAGNYIKNGGRVGYCAEAEVYHSHDYSCFEQFKRNFDLGVSQVDNPDIFNGVKSEKEGARYVLGAFRYLIDQRYYKEIPDLIAKSAFRYAGYMFGKHYKGLPQAFVKMISSNKNYWD